MNPSDPVIDEIRAMRRRISERVGHDPERLVAYYMELQKQYGDRLLAPLVDNTLSQADSAQGAEKQCDNASR